MDVINLLKQLISCRSLTPADAGSLDLISALLANSGFTVQRLPAGDVDNLWAYKGGETRLIFAGHVDVVPTGELSQWRYDPFTPTEEDGHLFGRGAADMKSGVAAMVVAAMNHPRDGVGVFLTSDEEGVARYGTRHFTEWWQQQGKEPIPYAVVGEPSCEQILGDAIKIGRRGSLTGHVQIHGKQGHAAYAHHVDNPIHCLLAGFAPLAPHWHDNIAAQARGEMVTTFQVVALQSGVGADNVTPPTANAVLNFRYAAPDTAASLKTKVSECLTHAAANAWECEWEHSAEPYCLPADSRLVHAMQKIVQTHTGQAPRLTTSGGVSDGRFLRHICSQVAEFGVLNSSIHAANENVKISDVRKLSDIYSALILDLV